jgi:hypothetical protein
MPDIYLSEQRVKPGIYLGEQRCYILLYQLFVIKIASDLQQVDGFLRVCPVSSTNKLTVTI